MRLASLAYSLFVNSYVLVPEILWSVVSLLMVGGVGDNLKGYSNWREVRARGEGIDVFTH